MSGTKRQSRTSRQRCTPSPVCFVVEDSAHTYETTLAALGSFARFVPQGGFFVVEDGCVDIEEMRLAPDWPRGVLPAMRCSGCGRAKDGVSRSAAIWSCTASLAILGAFCSVSAERAACGPAGSEWSRTRVRGRRELAEDRLRYAGPAVRSQPKRKRRIGWQDFFSGSRRSTAIAPSRRRSRPRCRTGAPATRFIWGTRQSA